MEEKIFYEYHCKYKIPKSLEKEVYSNNTLLSNLEKTNKVNLFVGANNSGKSKLIRELLKGKIEIHVNQKISDAINSKMEKARAEIKNIFEHQKTNETDWSITYRGSRDVIFSINDHITKLFNFKGEYLDSTANNSFPNYSVSGFAAHNEYVFRDSQGKLLLDTNATKLNSNIIALNAISNSLKEGIDVYKTPLWNVHKIYIPSVRSLREFASKTNIAIDTIKEYALDNKENGEISIQNGGDFYLYVLNNKNSYTENRRRIEHFENFLSENFFNSKRVEITSFIGDNKVVHIKIGDEKEQPIYNLGDGLQMIIILTFPFFKNDCGIVAIEEPELFIHPGLQKKFLDFLVNHPVTKNFQIFIATHSNHFIDAVNESELISIFTVSKKFKDGDTGEERLPDFIVDNVAFGHENCLRLLGVSNSSVYLANCTIWIEGITDKLYLSKYISEYLKREDLAERFKIFKNYQEGIHYSYIFSGGDNIVHWDFDDRTEYEELAKNVIAKKLCGKALVIVDNDFKKNPDRKNALKQLLNDRLIELVVPEIENLLSEEVIRKSILDYSTISDIGDSGFQSVSLEQIQSQKLGTVIDDLILKNVQGGKRFSASGVAVEKGKTIKSSDKLDFCKKAIEHIKYENMTDKSKELVEQILTFIVEHNSKFI